MVWSCVADYDYALPKDDEDSAAIAKALAAASADALARRTVQSAGLHGTATTPSVSRVLAPSSMTQSTASLLSNLPPKKAIADDADDDVVTRTTYNFEASSSSKKNGVTVSPRLQNTLLHLLIGGNTSGVNILSCNEGFFLIII